MSEQAAPATHKYVILESMASMVDDSPGELWAKIDTVFASSREKALELAANRSDDWQGGTLVAIREGSWVPTPVKVETKRNVTLG